MVVSRSETIYKRGLCQLHVVEGKYLYGSKTYRLMD